jgi:hypothetical protein
MVHSSTKKEVVESSETIELTKMCIGSADKSFRIVVRTVQAGHVVLIRHVELYRHGGFLPFEDQLADHSMADET